MKDGLCVRETERKGERGYDKHRKHQKIACYSAQMRQMHKYQLFIYTSVNSTITPLPSSLKEENMHNCVVSFSKSVTECLFALQGKTA